jgi:microcystin-dependent protein
MDGILGFTILFAGNFAPRNWAFCDGSMLPVRSNQALFSVIGTTYGGDGISTFALPDLRGRAVIGAGQGISNYDLGDLGGSEVTGPLSSITTPAHTHPIQVKITPPAAGVANSLTPASSVYAIGFADLYDYSTNAFLAPYNATIATTAAGSGNPPFLEILHPVLTLNYIICITGTFPHKTSDQ